MSIRKNWELHSLCSCLCFTKEKGKTL